MKTCKVSGCGNVVLAKEMCRAHYLRMYKNGTLELKRQKGKKCSVPGCEKKHAAKGYCKTHYQKVKNSGTIKYLRKFGGPCERCGKHSKNGKYIKHKCYSCYRKSKMEERGTFYDCVLTDRHRRRGAGNYEISFSEIYEKTNGICHICGEVVDINDVGSNKPSIDHIIPVSKGGTSESENLLLAHLSCNIKKFNK